MRFSQTPIQTHRENPANARTEGAGLLVRAGYVSHAGELLPLGKFAVERLRSFSGVPDFFSKLELSILSGKAETYFPLSTGSTEILHCPACDFASRLELAPVKKAAFSTEPPIAQEKVLTPDCPTIESLAVFLDIPQEKTAKALMFVRKADEKFVFVVVRGDMTMSEAKLAALVGETRLATEAEIRAVGAVPGYASPIGVKNALIAADDLIPQSPNLVAGANEAGYHLKNVNYGRDYSADIVADLTQATAGDPCAACGAVLESVKGWVLASKGMFDFEKILFALAETYHDEKGLTFPALAAPFDIYLMNVPGKTLNTASAAAELYEKLTASGLAVLFDDRDERAGVKFNDADLIGCPIRVTVGERGLQNGMVELKRRVGIENQQIPLNEIVEKIKEII
jgi:prolyl-tRNA synthetase